MFPYVETAIVMAQLVSEETKKDQVVCQIRLFGGVYQQTIIREPYLFTFFPSGQKCPDNCNELYLVKFEPLRLGRRWVITDLATGKEDIRISS